MGYAFEVVEGSFWGALGQRSSAGGAVVDVDELLSVCEI